MKFPQHRSRRLRSNPALRRMVRESRLAVSQLIQPVFLVEGRDVVEPLAAMPGQNRYSVDRAAAYCRTVSEAGVGAVLLFGVPSAKDPLGTGAYAQDGIVPRGVRTLKDALPDLLVFTDVCLCSYTSHGHCGVLDATPPSSGSGRRVRSDVDNDATLELLAKTAVAHANAGADVVAPSDMMDGRVQALRAALDQSGHVGVGILSYAVKYASAFYGPFREAAESAPQFGDRRGYQMDPANVREAVKVAQIAADEGADLIMVKPAMPSLDVIRAVRETITLPVAAYQVSGEYSMIEAAAARGWLDRNRVIAESLLGIRRAGADVIITYYAAEVAAGGIAGLGD